MFFHILWRSADGWLVIISEVKHNGFCISSKDVRSYLSLSFHCLRYKWQHVNVSKIKFVVKVRIIKLFIVYKAQSLVKFCICHHSQWERLIYILNTIQLPETMRDVSFRLMLCQNIEQMKADRSKRESFSCTDDIEFWKLKGRSSET